MRTINLKCNVPEYKSRTQHTQYKIIQWHDCRRPHASQWPKPAYHYLIPGGVDCPPSPRGPSFLDIPSIKESGFQE